MRFVLDVGKAVLALGTVAGTIWAAQQADALWVALVILGLALLYGLGRRHGSSVIDFAFRSRAKEYRSSIANLESDLAQAKVEIENLSREREKVYALGVAEGRARIVGMLSSPLVSLTLVALSASDAGLQLFARVADTDAGSGGPSVVGARFEVQVKATGESKGIVEAVSMEDGLVTLECVFESVPTFWAHLADRAQSEPDPPGGIVIRPTTENSYTASPALVRTDEDHGRVERTPSVPDTSEENQ